MDEDDDFQKAYKFIGWLTVQKKFTDNDRKSLVKNLEELICGFAGLDIYQSQYDNEIDGSKRCYNDALEKLYDRYVIRYQECEQNCETCKITTVTTEFTPGASKGAIIPLCTSRVSGDTYDCVYDFHKDVEFVNVITCKTKDVIFLLTCQDCGEQFVDSTDRRKNFCEKVQKLRELTKQSELNSNNRQFSHFHKHFASDNCIKFTVQIIQKFPNSWYKTKGTDIYNSVQSWVKKLMTYYPYGMNEKLKPDDKPLYSSKFFERYNPIGDTDGPSSASAIVDELMNILRNEDPRPMENIGSIFKCLVQNKDKNVRRDVKEMYASSIKEKSFSTQLKDLIEEMLRSSTTNYGVKYDKCKTKSCKTCANAIVTPQATSNVISHITGEPKTYDCIYEFSEGEKMVVSCSTKNVVYLLTCKQCGEQYVGRFKNEFRLRMNGHRGTVKNGDGCPLIKKHFYGTEKDGCEEFYVQIIHKLPEITKESSPENKSTAVSVFQLNESSASNYATKEDELNTRESEWIKKLATFHPYGMNKSKAAYTLSDLGLSKNAIQRNMREDGKSEDEIVNYLVKLLKLHGRSQLPMKHLKSIVKNLSGEHMIRKIEKKYLDQKEPSKNNRLDEVIMGVLAFMKPVPKYKRCAKANCTTCDYADDGDISIGSQCISTASKKTYNCVHHFDEGEDFVISCTTKNVIILLTCEDCEEQFVDQTGDPKEELGELIDSLHTTRKPHFSHPGSKCKNFGVQIIEKFSVADKRGAKQKLSKWIGNLKTFYPFGMNVKRRGRKNVEFIQNSIKEIDNQADIDEDKIVKILSDTLIGQDKRPMKNLDLILKLLSPVYFKGEEPKVSKNIEQEYKEKTDELEKDSQQQQLHDMIIYIFGAL